MAVASTVAMVGVGIMSNASNQRAARSVREENRINRANEISIRNQEIAAQNANNRASLEAQYNFAQAQIAIAQAQHAVNTEYGADLYRLADMQDEISADIRESGDEAFNLALRNASFIRQEGRENVRRENLVHDELEGILKSRQAASGLKTNVGSTKMYYDTFVNRNDQIIEWMRLATETQASLEEERGEYERTLANISADQVAVQAESTRTEADFLIANSELHVMNAEAHLAGIPSYTPIPSIQTSSPDPAKPRKPSGGGRIPGEGGGGGGNL